MICQAKILEKYHSLKVQETSINYLTVNMAGHRGIRGLQQIVLGPDYEVETGKFDTIEYQGFNISIIDDIDDIDDIDGDELETLEYMNEKTGKYKVPIKKSLARVMSATDSFLWEEQYDASQEETTAFDIPAVVFL